MISTIAQLTNKMNKLFTQTAKEVGEQSGYGQRQAQKWKAELFFSVMVGSHLAQGEASLSKLCHLAAMEGISVSNNGLNKRFNERSSSFMKAMLDQTIKTTVGIVEPVGINVLDRFDTVFISDGSLINLSPELVTIYKGCGKEPTEKDYAALKMQVGLDLCSGRLWGPVITEGHVHDSVAGIDSENLPAGSLVMRDLGYWDLQKFRERTDKAIYTLSRLKTNTIVFDRQGRKLDLIAVLEQNGQERVELLVMLGKKEKIACRLLASKVPEDIKLKRLQNCKNQDDKKGVKWAGWTILVTDVASDKLTFLEAFALYRARWQIELLFKRWKSIGKIDVWQTKNIYRILCEIYAKLIAMVISHWISVLGCWSETERSLWICLQLIQMTAICLILFMNEKDSLRRILEKLIESLWIVAKMSKNKKKPSTNTILADPSKGFLSPQSVWKLG